MPYTEGLFNYYDTDGVAGISREELRRIREDAAKIGKSGKYTDNWERAVDHLVDGKISKFSYMDIFQMANMMDSTSDEEIFESINLPRPENLPGKFF